MEGFISVETENGDVVYVNLLHVVKIVVQTKMDAAEIYVVGAGDVPLRATGDDYHELRAMLASGSTRFDDDDDEEDHYVGDDDDT